MMNKLLLLPLLVLTEALSSAQTAPGKYWIQFTDKNHNPYSLSKPHEFLSERALTRRNNQNLPPGEDDLPVSSAYKDSLQKLGYKIMNESKWFNSVTLQIESTEKLENLETLDFITQIQKVKRYKMPKSFTDKLQLRYKTIDNTDLRLEDKYGYAFDQIAIHNGQYLHEHGYTGGNMHIAVIDAGFYRADELPAFTRLWANGQILGTRDFVTPGSNVFQEHEHGMMVLSAIGGNIEGRLVGTAPDAKFWLLRSEDTASEYLIEEDNWISAAEYADSVGCDIINTSLGYSIFDDPLQNHRYEDMNGSSTRISLAAEIASGKGILVIVSAGNEGDNSWKYITAPADANHILSVGAIDKHKKLAPFSSVGPSADNRIKPEIVSIGYETVLQGPNGAIVASYGTSFSAPVISGLAACLWQARPDLTNKEIIQIILQSAHQSGEPDNLMGYGIPDFFSASLMKGGFSIITDNNVEVFPNPFADTFYMGFKEQQEGQVLIEVFDMPGQKVMEEILSYGDMGFYIIPVEKMKNLIPGIYILRVKYGNKTDELKVIKK